jgi:hypothetical protein
VPDAVAVVDSVGELPGDLGHPGRLGVQGSFPHRFKGLAQVIHRLVGNKKADSPRLFNINGRIE